jgi:hypothetical protein
MPYSIWIVLATPQNCACSLAAYVTIVTCGQVMHISFGLKKKAPIKWTNEMQKAFNKKCLLMAADALAAYPNHNKRFNMYTDASDF